MSNLNRASEILSASIEGGETDPDALMQALASTGEFKIARIPAYVNQVLESAGLRMSRSERIGEVTEFLATAEPMLTWEDVLETSKEAAEEIGNSTQAQVVTAIKAWAKANEVTLPKQTKSATGGGTRSNAFDNFTAHFIKNPSITDSEIDEYALNTILKKGEPNPPQAAKYAVIFKAAANIGRSFQ
mgnify:CR=1 FL=1|tara:strand:- start:396 stop:956 length:561 start_codon:yes stop_codon:yes gene_type:complete